VGTFNDRREKSGEAILKRGGAKRGVRPESSELTVPNRDTGERPEGGEIGCDMGMGGDLVFTQYSLIISNALPQKYSIMVESF
jgi:hypothetical protein